MREAIFTCLSTKDYVSGVLILNQSIKQYSDYKLNVLCTKEVYEEYKGILESEGIVVKVASEVSLPDAYVQKNERSDTAYWINTFIKLELFSFEEYDKILYIDSDIMLLDDISKIMSSAVFCAVEDSEFMMDTSLRGINSGVMVIIPKVEDYDRLKAVMENMLSENGVCFGDQDVISRVFCEDKAKFDCMSACYNANAYSLDFYPSDIGDNIKAVHFITSNKPWNWSPIYAFIRIASYYIRGRRKTGYYAKQYYKLSRKVREKLQ